MRGGDAVSRRLGAEDADLLDEHVDALEPGQAFRDQTLGCPPIGEPHEWTRTAASWWDGTPKCIVFFRENVTDC